MASLPIFYTFRRCPYAMRARLAVDVVGCDVEWREVALSNKPAALIEASPKGTVPVWVGSDGQVIDQSLSIMQHLFAPLDDDNLNPQGNKRERDLALIAQCDGPFKHHLDRYKYHTRYPGESPVQHRDAVEAILQEWARRLVGTGYLNGADQGLTDLAIAPFVRQCRIADPAWFDQQPWPALHRWLDAFLKSDRFERVMVKRPLWQP